jgi:hypothetical protein
VKFLVITFRPGQQTALGADGRAGGEALAAVQ